MRLFHWAAAPADATPTQKKNFLYVQIDAIGVGLASSATTFLPVFLTRLGATNFQVGLLTSMPAFTGLFLAILMGRFLQSRRNVAPWFSITSLLNFSSYALIGLMPFLVPSQYVVLGALVIRAAVTLPQTMRNVAFSVVMNSIAGPRGRYTLMSRRWSLLGLASAITVAIVGQVLDQFDFPANYQWVFIGLSVGGLISFFSLNRVELPDTESQPRVASASLPQRIRGYVYLIGSQRAFISFLAKRQIYVLGTALAAPLFPLYFVRQVQATNAWIGIISTSQTAIMMIGYFFWVRKGRTRGSRFVLLRTTFGLALYPALVASTQRVELIALCAGLAGVFQAGLDLVFFDELMNTVPADYSATFVSVAQTVQYFLAVIAPIVSTLLADRIGIGGALIVSAAVQMAGFGLFAWGKKTRSEATEPQQV